MNKTSQGWMLFIAALGMFSTMVAVDVSQINAWDSAFAPSFVGKCLGYFGTVVASFIAGKLIPNKD